MSDTVDAEMLKAHEQRVAKARRRRERQLRTLEKTIRRRRSKILQEFEASLSASAEVLLADSRAQ